MVADSYLGALFEGRNLNNDAVNFLGTLCAALAGATGWQPDGWKVRDPAPD